MWLFNELVDGFRLFDFDLEGSQVTFTNKQQPPSLSRLDSFLVSAGWLEHFYEHREVATHFYGLDHRVLVWMACKLRRTQSIYTRTYVA